MYLLKLPFTYSPIIFEFEEIRIIRIKRPGAAIPAKICEKKSADTGLMFKNAIEAPIRKVVVSTV